MKKPLILVGALLALAGCKPQEENTFRALLSQSVFTTGYVSDFSPYEAIAASLRDSDSRYLAQKLIWKFEGTGPNYSSYSLDHANVEYAHAVGLTGDGQTIAIVDAGFQPDHIEFAGKYISVSYGAVPTGDLLDANHGTGVAAIAAGSADFGETLGVAPGANLHLGYYTSDSSTTIATNEAAALGAIVMNNSWGWPSAHATQSDFNTHFGSGSGATYLQALKSYANNGVIVWAASNQNSRVVSDLSAALPKFAPSLESSWISVVDAVPTTSGQSVTGATLISSACLDAARWCMVADGTVWAANAQSETSYALASGTSFAAPQVSGAVAILAEAFPNLSAQELRARILASADNGFYTHTGTVEFAPGISHGYDETFGHGFLDLKAALLPIGSTYVPRSDGSRIVIDQPVILGGGMAGDAVVTRLADHEITFVDGLGGQFDTGAEILTATPVVTGNPFGAISDLLEVDLFDGSANPFHQSENFGSFLPGSEFQLAYGGGDISLLLPDGNGSRETFGLAVSRTVDLEGVELNFGLSFVNEDDGFAGIRSMIEGESLAALQTTADFGVTLPLGHEQSLSLSGAAGLVSPLADSASFNLGEASYNSFAVSYGLGSLVSPGDRLSISVGLPQSLQSGTARVELPSVLSSGAQGFSNADISLVPDARQVDFAVSYGIPVTDNASLLFSATHSRNVGHIADAENTSAAMGWKISF